MTPARSPALDGLRALAALAVMAHHAPLVLGARWSTALGLWAPQGTLGVDVFFVLSGFLITTVLLRARAEGAEGAGLLPFWGRRALRIVPPYALYLGSLALLAATTSLLDGPHVYEPQGDGALFAAFLANVPPSLGRDPGTTLVPLWSVAVEEQFYVLWPLVVLGLPPRRGVGVALAGVGIALAARWWLWGAVGAHVAYFATPARVDQLLVGALLAHGRASPRWRCVLEHAAGRLLPAAAAWLALAVGTPGGAWWAGHRGWCALAPLGVALAAAVVLVALLDGRGLLARALSWRPLVALGRVSYGLYLWHALVGVLLARVLPASWPLEARVVPWVAASWALAHGLFELVERRLLAVGRARSA